MDAILVVDHPAGAGAGGDAREGLQDLHRIPREPLLEGPPFLVCQIDFKGHFIFRIVEHFQQTPRPDIKNIREQLRQQFD